MEKHIIKLRLRKAIEASGALDYELKLAIRRAKALGIDLPNDLSIALAKLQSDLMSALKGLD